MILLQVDILRLIAEWIGLVFSWTSPFVVPFGIFMRIWIDFCLQFFPTDMNFYITIFLVLVISAFIVNIKWSGKEKEIVYKKEEEKGIEESVAKCKYCGKPLGDSEFCPYCGSRN